VNETRVDKLASQNLVYCYWIDKRYLIQLRLSIALTAKTVNDGMGRQNTDHHGIETVAYPGILFGGGGSTNSVEDSENGDLGAVAP
jgi:hypothetical protein